MPLGALEFEPAGPLCGANSDEQAHLAGHATGALADDDREFRTLTHHSNMIGVHREWAACYQAGDILKYTSGSKLYGIERESSATVVSTRRRDNTLTVKRGLSNRCLCPQTAQRRERIPGDHAKVCHGRPHPVHRTGQAT